MIFKGFKYLFPLLAFLISLNAYSQKIGGIVTGKTTKQPVSGALVRIGNSKTLTDIAGRFQLALPSPHDSLNVAHFAYKPYTIAVDKGMTVLVIELEPKTISLNTVTVHGNRDFKQDSIENRKVFAKQFNYTGPRVMDAFTGNADNRQPFEFISVNPLLLIAALTKKSTPEYKFNKILIRDEHEQYIDEHFNKGIVGRVTDLKGDSLSAFLMQYRPTYEFVKKSTEYDMEIYIRQSFKKFKAEGGSRSNPFHDAANKKEDGVKLN